MTSDKAERGKGGLSAMRGGETTHQGRAKGDGRLLQHPLPCVFSKQIVWVFRLP